MWFSQALVWLHQINFQIILSLKSPSAKNITNSSLHTTLIKEGSISILIYSLENNFMNIKIDQQSIEGNDSGSGVQRFLPSVKQSGSGRGGDHFYIEPQIS